MKNILFTVIIIAGAFQLKAQQKFITINSMLFKAPKNLDHFKLSDSSLFKNFNVPEQNQLAMLNSLIKYNNIEVFYSRMPVLKVSPGEKMPIVYGANVENMPILKIKVVDALAPAQPGNP